MKTKIYFSVSSTEVDGMGIVHHAYYPVWFERGRKDYLKKAGTSGTHFAGLGFYLPLSEIECKYYSPARYGDDIVVITKVLFISCAKVKFEYSVFEKKKAKLLARGITVHAWTNEKIEPINVEKAAPDFYYKLKQFSESPDGR